MRRVVDMAAKPGLTALMLAVAMNLLGCAEDAPPATEDTSVTFPDFGTTPDPGVPRDTGSGPTDTSTGPAELPPVTVGQCNGTPGDKPIMSACQDHCECVTGYCYDENYLGSGFKFCSMDCSNPSIGSCASIQHPTEPGIQKYGCLQLNSLKDDYSLETTRICVLRCNDTDECKQYSTQYDQCGNFSGNNATMWEGHTIAAFATCLIEAEISPDEP